MLHQATVLLAVNVSFLAIPDAAPAADTVTIGFVASLCSAITSVGCIVVGLLLVNEDHTNPKGAHTVSIFAMYSAVAYYSHHYLYSHVSISRT